MEDVSDDLARFEASGLTASSLCPAACSLLPTPAVPGEPTAAGRIDAIRRGIERAAPFAPSRCCAVPGPFGEDPATDRAVVTEGLGVLAVDASAAGIGLMVELVHPALTGTFSYLSSLTEAIELLEAVGRPEVMVAFDMWHGGEDGPELCAEMRAHAGRASIHLADRRDPTRSWRDRVLPGDGTVDYPGGLRALRTGGFDGWWELEIVSDDGRVQHDFLDSLWKVDPAELIARGAHRAWATLLR